MNKLVLSYLSKVFLFKDCSDKEIAETAERCQLSEFSPGEVIHSSKTPLRGIGVVVSGRARIVSGKGDTLLRILKPGDIFGAASVFAIDSANRTAVIASGICSVLLVPEDVIRETLLKNPSIAITYIGFLSERIDFLNTRISSLAAGDAVAKVAGYLLSLNFDSDGNTVIEDSFTTIASKLNMGRASLYRTIDRFVADGYISREKERLTVLDRDSLEDIILGKNSGDPRKRKANQ